jgi:hypothetical protein
MDPVSIVLSGNDQLLSTLPYELLFRIATHLDYPDIVRLCRVSRIFHQVCQDDYFWTILYQPVMGKNHYL